MVQIEGAGFWTGASASPFTARGPCSLRKEMQYIYQYKAFYILCTVFIKKNKWLKNAGFDVVYRIGKAYIIL